MKTAKYERDGTGGYAIGTCEECGEKFKSDAIVGRSGKIVAKWYYCLACEDELIRGD